MIVIQILAKSLAANLQAQVIAFRNCVRFLKRLENRDDF